MSGLGGFALGAAPIAGGALLGLAAGNLRGPDVRGAIKADMELLDKLPPEDVELRAALKQSIDQRIRSLIAGTEKSHELLEVAVDDVEIRIAGQRIELQHQAVRGPEVVGVEKGQHVAGRVVDSVVEGFGEALLLQAMVAHRRKRACDVGRAVRRRVVDDVDVERGMLLVQDAPHAFGEVTLAVVHGNDDADRWRGGTHRRTGVAIAAQSSSFGCGHPF